MNRSILFDYLSDYSLDTGSLVGFYSFGQYSGDYTFNEKYSDPTGSSISGSNVRFDRYPLVSLCTGETVNSVSGSGYFEGDSVVQVGHKFDKENWTVILNYKSDDFSTNKNLGRTLFTSYTSGADSSGFSVGLNGAQKLYFEYKDSGNAKRIKTLNAELGDKNIISISKSTNSKTVELTFHDFLYDSSSTGTFDISNAFSGATDLTISNKLYFGDYYQTGVADYTGFSGYLDNLLIFDNAIAETDKRNLAKLMISSGYLKQRKTEETFLYTGFSGYPTVATGITSSGVTGYQNALSGTIPSRHGGSDIDIYVSSGVSGGLTGTTITYSSSSTILTGTRLTLADPELLTDNSLLSKYSRNNLTIFDEITNSGSLEVYNFYSINSNTNYNPSAVLSATGYLDLTTGYTSGEKFSLFVNGVYQRSGAASGASILSGDYYRSGSRKVYLESGVSFSGELFDSVFDKYTGAFDSEIHDYTGETIVSKNWGSYDIYLNGMKLLSGSGEDYYQSGTSIVVNTGSLHGATGELLAAPRQNFNNRITGINDELFTDSSGFLSEQVWLNGQRVLRNKNYKLVSDNSLLNNENKIRFIDDFNVYNGEEQGF